MFTNTLVSIVDGGVRTHTPEYHIQAFPFFLDSDELAVEAIVWLSTAPEYNTAEALMATDASWVAISNGRVVYKNFYGVPQQCEGNTHYVSFGGVYSSTNDAPDVLANTTYELWDGGQDVLDCGAIRDFNNTYGGDIADCEDLFDFNTATYQGGMIAIEGVTSPFSLGM